ncbi:hypothetical protein COC96_09755 [Bacillus cereus]|nr:hypothetical protein COC96_09755 [Bacillus cereus]
MIEYDYLPIVDNSSNILAARLREYLFFRKQKALLKEIPYTKFMEDFLSPKINLLKYLIYPHISTDP